MAGMLKTQIPWEFVNVVVANFFKTFHKFIFSDVLPFIRRARNQDYEVWILTAGNKIWQEMQIENSGLLPWLSGFHIVEIGESKVNFIIDKAYDYDHIIVVENDPRQLDNIQEHNIRTDRHLINRMPDEFINPVNEADRRRWAEARWYLNIHFFGKHIPCRSFEAINL